MSLGELLFSFDQLLVSNAYCCLPGYTTELQCHRLKPNRLLHPRPICINLSNYIDIGFNNFCFCYLRGTNLKNSYPTVTKISTNDRKCKSLIY
jgi:hypothetical protein